MPATGNLEVGVSCCQAAGNDDASPTVVRVYFDSVSELLCLFCPPPLTFSSFRLGNSDLLLVDAVAIRGRSFELELVSELTRHEPFLLTFYSISLCLGSASAT